MIPEAVDGVPWGAPANADPDGFRAGIDRAGDDVGQWTSLSIGTDGQARISYKDMEDFTLKYGQGTPGNWTVHTVADAGSDKESVWHTEIILDGADIPRILYMVHGIADATGTFRSEFRMATATSASPASSTDWTVETIDATRIPCAGLCDTDFACVEADWSCQPIETTCGGACGTNEACVGGACVAVIPDLTYTEHPKGVGLYPSADWMADGRLVVAYYDRVATDARLAVLDTGVWTVTTVEGGATEDVGLYTSLVVASDDTVHVVYHDAVRDHLVYRWFDATLAPQGREIVDDGIKTDGPHTVGADAKIFLDAAGAVRVFYQDGHDADLLGAVRNGPDDWTLAPVMTGAPLYGFFTDVTQDSDGTFWGAQYVYDRAGDPFGMLQVWQITL